MEDISLARFAFAFVFVLGLIGLSALAARRFGGKLMLPVSTKEGRVRVVEACPVGPRHRLVLIRRDNVEHLLLLGPETSLVVEQGIESHA